MPYPPPLNVDQILQVLCEKIADSQKVTYCRISLLDRATGSLVVKAVSPTRNITAWRQGIGESLDLSRALHHAGVLESGKPTVLRKKEQVSGENPPEEWE